MPKFVVTKAMNFLLETTNNSGEWQLVWWYCGYDQGVRVTLTPWHDCVVRSHNNLSVPLLPGSTMRSVDGTMVQLRAVLAFWWILPMNLPATISSVQVPILSHKNVVASEASNSRLVIIVKPILFLCTRVPALPLLNNSVNRINVSSRISHTCLLISIWEKVLNNWYLYWCFQFHGIPCHDFPFLALTIIVPG